MRSHLLRLRPAALDGGSRDALGNEAQDRCLAVGPGFEQRCDGRVPITEERDDKARCGRTHAELAPERGTRRVVGKESIAPRQEIALAEQSSARGGKARKEEVPRERAG